MRTKWLVLLILAVSSWTCIVQSENVSLVVNSPQHQSTHFSRDQCNWWNSICYKIDPAHRDKVCTDNTIFYTFPHSVELMSSRFYCKSVFHSFPNADLLNLHSTDAKAKAEELQLFLDKFFSQPGQLGASVEVVTSAICCPTINVDGNRVGKVLCNWANNDLDDSIKDDEFEFGAIKDKLINSQCTFLTMQLDATGARFKQTIPYDAPKNKYQLICTFTRPTGCVKQLPSTSTTPPPTTTISTATKDTATVSTTATTIKTSGDHRGWCAQVRNAYGIALWPSVASGHWSTVSCPSGFEGEARWFCQPDGAFKSSGPYITCRQSWIKPLYDELRKVDTVVEFVNKSKHFVEKVADSSMKFQAEIGVMVDSVKIIQIKSNHFVNNFTVDQMSEVTRTILSGCDKIVASEKAWSNGQSANRVRMAEDVLQYVQYAGVNLGCYEANTNVELDGRMKSKKVNSQIFLNAFNLDVEQPVHFAYDGNVFGLTRNLSRLHEAVGEVVSEHCNHQIGVGAVFLNLAHQLSFENNTANIKINSEIVAFNYNNKTANVSLQLPAETFAQMRLGHHQRLEFGVKPQCVFWNFAKSAWSSEGCWLDVRRSGREYTTCVCNHLTNFAVLMDVSGRERPSRVKDILSIVCTSASNLCLIVIILIYVFNRDLRTTSQKQTDRRAIILINLSGCLLVVNMLVLFGLDQLKNAALCKGISVTLLFALTSMFSWMLMEGYNLYQMIILVFYGKGRMNTLMLYVFGYGVPAVMTTITTIFIGLYGELTSEYFCWISSPKYPAQTWAIAGPGSAVMLVNLFIIVQVLRTVVKMRGNTAKATFLGGTKSKSGGGSAAMTSVSPEPNGFRTNNLIMFNTKDVIGEKGTQAHKRSTNKENGTSAAAAAATTSTATDDPTDEEAAAHDFRLWWAQWWAFAKGYISLFFLMGVTWAVYVLYIHEFGHFFSYVFIVLNGLQGVFIFLTQVVINKKATKAMRKVMHNWLTDDILGRWSTTESGSRQTKSMTKSSVPTTTTNTSSRRDSRDDVLSGNNNNNHHHHHNNSVVPRFGNAKTARTPSMEYF